MQQGPARRLGSSLRQAAGPAAVLAATILLRPLHPNLADVALTYLLAVLLASTAAGLWPGAVTAVLGAAAMRRDWRRG